MFRRFALIAVAALLAIVPNRGAQALSFQEPADLALLVRAAAAEGTLNIAWGDVYGGAEGARRAQAAIDRHYHIDLRINYSGVANGAAFQNSVVQEVRAGQTASSDILFHVRDAGIAKFTQQADFRKYVPGLPEDVMYYDKHSVVAVTTILAEEYNSKLIPPDQVPNSLAGLLDPRWKGKIATAPYEGVLAWYLGLPNVLGYEGMVKFFTALSAQLGGLMTCGESDRVASGEFLLYGLDCGDQDVRLRARRGQPVAVFYPKEGTAIYTFAPGIPLTAAHPNAARLFIAYLLSREGQAMLWDTMGCDNAELPGSHMAGVIAAARRKGVKFIETYGLDVKYPQLIDYQRDITKIISQSR
jgi:ABC-type Fe3+ transport system substrate-binding protein